MKLSKGLLFSISATLILLCSRCSDPTSKLPEKNSTDTLQIEKANYKFWDPNRIDHDSYTILRKELDNNGVFFQYKPQVYYFTLYSDSINDSHFKTTLLDSMNASVNGVLEKYYKYKFKFTDGSRPDSVYVILNKRFGKVAVYSGYNISLIRSVNSQLYEPEFKKLFLEDSSDFLQVPGEYFGSIKKQL